MAYTSSCRLLEFCDNQSFFVYYLITLKDVSLWFGAEYFVSDSVTIRDILHDCNANSVTFNDATLLYLFAREYSQNQKQIVHFHQNSSILFFPHYNYVFNQYFSHSKMISSIFFFYQSFFTMYRQQIHDLFNENTYMFLHIQT